MLIEAEERPSWSYLVGLGDGLQLGQLLGALPRGQNTIAQNAAKRGETERPRAKAAVRVEVGEWLTGGSATHAQGQVSGLTQGCIGEDVWMAPSHINRVLSVGPQALSLQQNTLNKCI